MSQLVMLILPAPANLDTIRSCLAERFALNPKVEGLGDVEELHATDEAGRTTVFEAVIDAPSEMLRDAISRRAGRREEYTCFLVRYGWATSEAALVHAAGSLHGWVYDSWSRLLSPAEFRAELSAGARPE